IVSTSISGERFQSLVCKRNLNPVYEPKDAKFDFIIYTSLMHKLGTLEFIVWDVDRIRNDYLGECAFPVYQWFNGTAFAFDSPNNERFQPPPPHPYSIGLISSRLTTLATARGTMHIKVWTVWFFRPPDSTSQPDFGKTYDALVAKA
ncbi:hypothetical protein BJY52DRAFT_1077915, partial [Lactarius psammicola]